ncbi:hypothetical protein F4819DRAFT_191997 [Hypoxylon fuscum]|nr:hypothetical protein F4819DRAFT_191997 [Hypoxylon fuscum]
MPHPNQWNNPRRSYSGYEPARRDRDSYKPGEARSQSNDRLRDQERDRRDSDRESRRDPRDFRPPRSPRAQRRDIESPLHIDTKVPTGPRRSVSSTISPSSAPPSAFSTAPSTRPTPTEPAADRMAKPFTLANSGVTRSIPKAKDPKLQGPFETLFKWNETQHERMLLKLRKEKLLREGHRRQHEYDRASNKVDDFAPFSEFRKRFEESGKVERENIDTQINDLDQRYLEDLEKVISSLTQESAESAKLQAATAAQNSSVLALETKFAEFEKQATEQQKEIANAQAQIQTLLGEREKSTEAFNTVSEYFKTLSEEFKVLKAEYNVLRPAHDILRRKYEELQPKHLALEQKVSNLDSTERVQGELDRVSNELQSFKTKMDGVETQVTTFMEKVEDLDMKTYNEILETWTDYDFKNKVISNEKSAMNMRQDLGSFKESVTAQFDKTGALIQEMRKTFEAQSNNQASGQVSGDHQLAQEAIDNKFRAFGEAVKNTIIQSGDECADMVQEVTDRMDKNDIRMDKVEAAFKTLEQPAASKDVNTTARSDHLEQIATQQTQQGANTKRLEGRIGALEGQRLGPRIDNVGVGLAELEKKIQILQQSNAGGGTVNPDVILSIVKPDMDNARKRLEMLNLIVNQLDSRFNNLNSKEMAERILLRLDPYAQRNETRLAEVEKRVTQMWNKVVDIEGNVNLRLFKGSLKAADDGKRQISPDSPREGATKKRKLDTNGQ